MKKIILTALSLMIISGSLYAMEKDEGCNCSDCLLRSLLSAGCYGSGFLAIHAAQGDHSWSELTGIQKAGVVSGVGLVGAGTGIALHITRLFEYLLNLENHQERDHQE